MITYRGDNGFKVEVEIHFQQNGLEVIVYEITPQQDGSQKVFSYWFENVPWCADDIEVNGINRSFVDLVNADKVNYCAGLPLDKCHLVHSNFWKDLETMKIEEGVLELLRSPEMRKHLQKDRRCKVDLKNFF